MLKKHEDMNGTHSFSLLRLYITIFNYTATSLYVYTHTCKQGQDSFSELSFGDFL